MNCLFALLNFSEWISLVSLIVSIITLGVGFVIINHQLKLFSLEIRKSNLESLPRFSVSNFDSFIRKHNDKFKIYLKNISKISPATEIEITGLINGISVTTENSDSERVLEYVSPEQEIEICYNLVNTNAIGTDRIEIQILYKDDVGTEYRQFIKGKYGKMPYTTRPIKV